MALEIFTPVLGTISEFIDWSLAIVSIMIIWYVIKFFIVAPPTEAEKKKGEAEWAERGARGREWIKEKLREPDKNKLKEEKEREERIKDIEPIKGFLVEAIEGCEDFATSLKDKDKNAAIDSAEKHLKGLKKSLKHTAYHLRKLRRKNKEFDLFDNLSTNAGLALSKAKEIEIPDAAARDWNTLVRKIYSEVMGNEGIRAICAAILKGLESQKRVELKRAASQKVEEQVQEKAKEKSQKRESAREQSRQRRGGRAPRRGRRAVGSRPVGVVRKK